MIIIPKLKVFIVCTAFVFANEVKAQYGGGMGGMGYYPYYPNYGVGGMPGGGGGMPGGGGGMPGGGCGGYPRPCYYPQYPIYGNGYPCFTSVCCSCGGGGSYPYYGGAYPYYGNTMRTFYSNVVNYASSTASSIGGYFG
ncbi:uncharacterized protein LOC133330727 [Musca vetustissima]|uniref:uncharacterized protein LOC133330727 n=1 Tax=Musca vetustissima TaxID=27455 RepID=UPI002AB63128|nr:uncharacterized protein LOC133330727 [Musca vetustissima]